MYMYTGISFDGHFDVFQGVVSLVGGCFWEGVFWFQLFFFFCFFFISCISMMALIRVTRMLLSLNRKPQLSQESFEPTTTGLAKGPSINLILNLFYCALNLKYTTPHWGFLNSAIHCTFILVISILKQIVFVALFIAVLRKYQSKCCDNGTSFFRLFKYNDEYQCETLITKIKNKQGIMKSRLSQ